MLPLVIDELRTDLLSCGRCNYSICDTEDEFSIRRIDPSWEIYTLEIY